MLSYVPLRYEFIIVHVTRWNQSRMHVEHMEDMHNYTCSSAVIALNLDMNLDLGESDRLT